MRKQNKKYSQRKRTYKKRKFNRKKSKTLKRTQNKAGGITRIVKYKNDLPSN